MLARRGCLQNALSCKRLRPACSSSRPQSLHGGGGGSPARSDSIRSLRLPAKWWLPCCLQLIRRAQHWQGGRPTSRRTRGSPMRPLTVCVLQPHNRAPTQLPVGIVITNHTPRDAAAPQRRQHAASMPHDAPPSCAAQVAVQVVRSALVAVQPPRAHAAATRCPSDGAIGRSTVQALTTAHAAPAPQVPTPRSSTLSSERPPERTT